MPLLDSESNSQSILFNGSGPEKNQPKLKPRQNDRFTIPTPMQSIQKKCSNDFINCKISIIFQELGISVSLVRSSLNEYMKILMPMTGNGVAISEIAIGKIWLISYLHIRVLFFNIDCRLNQLRQRLNGEKSTGAHVKIKKNYVSCISCNTLRLSTVRISTHTEMHTYKYETFSPTKFCNIEKRFTNLRCENYSQDQNVEGEML